MKDALPILPKTIFENFRRIQQKSPVIHNITNLVVMQLTANALLAVGASPIMAHALEEMADISKIANALVLNIGTLDSHWINSMERAIELAQNNHLPIVLDPVGVGATKLRTETALRLLSLGKVAVIRGNAAEIMALAGVRIQSKGVDSQYLSEAAFEAMQKLNAEYQSVVVVSGAEDLVMQNDTCSRIQNGCAMMAKTTGMGCTATSLIGAFCAVNANYFEAAVSAMSVMGIAGEVAEVGANGPGSFQIQFIDALYNLSEEMIARRVKHENS